MMACLQHGIMIFLRLSQIWRPTLTMGVDEMNSACHAKYGFQNTTTPHLVLLVFGLLLLQPPFSLLLVSKISKTKLPALEMPM